MARSSGRGGRIDVGEWNVFSKGADLGPRVGGEWSGSRVVCSASASHLEVAPGVTQHTFMVDDRLRPRDDAPEALLDGREVCCLDGDVRSDILDA